MKHAWMAVLGAVLVLVGGLGIVMVMMFGGGNAATPFYDSSPRDYDPRGPMGPRGDDYFTPPGDRDDRLSGEEATLGARIYLDGVGENGRPVPRTAVGPGMMGGGCVICHGIDGQGGQFTMMGGTIEAPAITYEELTTEHGMSDSDIRRAIEEGVEPNGEELSEFMPRWRLTDREFEALLGYLKELNQQ